MFREVTGVIAEPGGTRRGAEGAGKEPRWCYVDRCWGLSAAAALLFYSGPFAFPPLQALADSFHTKHKAGLVKVSRRCQHHLPARRCLNTVVGIRSQALALMLSCFTVQKRSVGPWLVT